MDMQRDGFLKKALLQNMGNRGASDMGEAVGYLLIKLAGYDTTINGQPDAYLESVKLQLLEKSVKMLGAFTACPELAACLAGLEALTNRIRCRQW